MYLSRNEIPEGWSPADSADGDIYALERLYPGLPKSYSLRGRIEFNLTDLLKGESDARAGTHHV